MPTAQRREPFVIWLLRQLIESQHTHKDDLPLVRAALGAAGRGRRERFGRG